MIRPCVKRILVKWPHPRFGELAEPDGRVLAGERPVLFSDGVYGHLWAHEWEVA